MPDKTKLTMYGGTPELQSGWPSWPWFDQEMIDAVSKVLVSGKVNYWTGESHVMAHGPRVRGENGLFEYEFAKYHDVPYAIALANGTLALELALQAFGVGHGHEVITTSRTFIASASVAVMRGAKPVFADIDKKSQNLSADTICDLINEKTRAVIAVHLAGWACEMDSLRTLLDVKEEEYGHRIYLIEDCAQCLGGEYKGQKLGSIGDAGCFSFCQDKIITTGGEGGMLITNDDQVYRRAWSFKDHGKNFDKYNQDLEHPLVDEHKAKNLSYYSSLGTNWRMTEIQAVIGRAALSKLDSWNIKNRRRNARILDRGFSKVNGLEIQKVPNDIKHSYYKYYVYLEIEKLKEGWSRERIIKVINEAGVPCQFGSTWGIGKEDVWKEVKMPDGEVFDLQIKEDFPNDKWVGERSLMFQVHPTLEKTHMDATVKTVKNILYRAIK